MVLLYKSRSGEHGFAYASGVHVVGTALWCDAARARAVSFVSRPDVSLGRGRADRVVITELASALRRAISLPCEDPLLPRYGRPFALGRARVELLPSGGAPGGAQLLVELGGWRGLYAGRVCLQAITGIEPVQLRACDELVIDAPIGGGIVDGPEALLRVVGARGPVQVELEELAALGAVVALVGPERVVLPSRWRKAARVWPGLGLIARDKISRGGAPARAQSRSSAPLPRVFLGARPEAAAPGSLGLGLLPSAVDLARFVIDSGARHVWVRVDGSAARVRGGQDLLGALAAAGVPAAPIAPPEQLSLFPPTRW